MAELIDSARKHVESLVADLEGEADFMPFMAYDGTTRGEPSTGYVGLVMPDNEERNDLADVMIAILAINRATEATFASVSWAVTVQTREELDGKMPSEHPDRVEVVFMLHVAPEGDTFHQARINRIDGRVVLGDWEVSKQKGEAGGRFADAMHMGIDLGQNLPPEMIRFIDARIDEDPEALVQPFLRAMGHIRRGDQ